MILMGIDVETTGLDINKDKLLSIALRAYDTTLTPLDAGIQLVRNFPRATVEVLRQDADPFVQEMHDKTDLWNQVIESEISDATFKETILNYLSSYRPLGDEDRRPGDREIVFIGSSLKLDWYFTTLFCPEVAELVNYRVIDISSLKLIGQTFFGIQPLDNVSQHVAMLDIQDSISELRHFMTALAIADPTDLELVLGANQ